MESIKRAAAYIRVSTAEQSTKGLSIETQIAEIENYAQLNNMKLEEVYIDRGITARKSLEKRVDFMRMMRDVESGRINHIIVLRLDRFFRNVYDYHKMMREYLEPNKCDWSAVKEQYTTTTTNGRLMINLRLSIAEQECDTDSDRIKDVLDHRARQGFAISGSQPFGYKIVDHRVVPDGEKVPMVQYMFDQMEVLCSVKKVLKQINKKYGTKFSYNTVLTRLRNTMYYGKYRDIENYCEPIITKEQFDRVQYLIKKNVRARKNNYIHIFSGLVVCDCCNSKMVGRNSFSGDRKKIYFHYRCNKAVQNYQCANKQTINYKIIESYLLRNLRGMLKKQIIIADRVAEEDTEPKENRKTIEQKMVRLSDLYVNGFIDMEKYKADFADLQAQIVEVSTSKPKKDTTAIKNFLKIDFEGIYETLSDIEKQALWRTIIKEIRVSGRAIKDIKFL